LGNSGREVAIVAVVVVAAISTAPLSEQSIPKLTVVAAAKPSLTIAAPEVSELHV